MLKTVYPYVSLKNIMKKLTIILIVVIITGCTSIKQPFVINPILEKDTFKQGESTEVKAEIINISNKDFIISHTEPRYLTLDLWPVKPLNLKKGDAIPASIASGTSDGIQFQIQTIKIPSKSSFPKTVSSNLSFKRMNQSDSFFSGFFADFKPGKYYLTVSYNFWEQKNTTWSGRIKSEPVIVTIVK